MTGLTVNDRPVEYRLPPDTPLLWALRDASGLTGTKYGCGTGRCGACTVDVDGRAVAACVAPIGALEGAYVTTIEGLSPDRSHPLQVAFLAENAIQCGYCVPGMMMAASVLLKRNGDPDAAAVAAAVPNLCRCGIYPRAVAAILRAARIARGEEVAAPGARPGIDPAEAARAVPALTPR